MAIIKKKIGNTIYVYEAMYETIENGKRRYKWKTLGKLDADGNLIPSKKRRTEQSQEVKALAVIASDTEAQVSSITSEPIEPEVITVDDDYTYTSTSSEPSGIEDLPQVTSKKANQFKMGTTKVENTIFDHNKNKGIYDASELKDVRINVSRGNSQKKRIETLLYIDFNDAKANGLAIFNENRLTSYDREIYNAIATLVAAGNTHISPSMIFQLLSGNVSDERNKMGDETREKIVRSVEKLSATRIAINAVSEFKAGMIAEADFVGYLVPATRVEIMLNGQRVKDCVHILDQLPLFTYASKKKQIVSIDVKLLNTPLANTPENIELKTYLLRRILSMVNSKNNMSDAIRYDTIYEYLKVKAATNDSLKHKRKQVRDKIKILLNFWKNAKLIKGYEEEKEGKVFVKVLIYF